MAKKKKMTAKRFQELVGELRQTSQEAAANLLGIGRRSFIRYWNNQEEPPTYVRRLLLMLVEHGPMDQSKEW